MTKLVSSSQKLASVSFVIYIQLIIRKGYFPRYEDCKGSTGFGFERGR